MSNQSDVNTLNERSGGSWWRAWDVILIVGVLSLVPLLFVYVQQLWTSTELVFFPLLPLASLAFMGFQAKIGDSGSRTRAVFAIVLLVLSSVAAVYGAWVLAPWLAAVSLTLLWLSWMLARLGENPWHQVTGWLLPMMLLLIFPLAPEYDMTVPMESSVLASSSGVLDMLGVPHLPADDRISTQSSQVAIAQICRGLSSPYVLLSLSLLLVMLTQSRFVVGLLTMLTVPVWSWLAANTHLTLGLYLLERHEVVLFTDSRNLLVQAGLLVLSLLFVWLTSIALHILLAPFLGYSSTSNWAHKFYNRLVYWPNVDPLRKRRFGEEKAGWAARAFWGWRPIWICLLVATGLLIAGGGYSGYQVFGG